MSRRGGWVMRRVAATVRVPSRANHVDEIAIKTHWRNGEPCRIVEKDRLECGHLKWPEHIDSKADALRAVFRSMEPGKPHKRRCHRCGEATKASRDAATTLPTNRR